MKSLKRKAAMASKRSQKQSAMMKPGAKSRYAKKKAYLNRNGLWGFQVSEPKPWK